MAKIDLDAMSIEELASLRDRAIEKLAERVAARQAELEAELDRLSQYGGKPARKVQAAPAAPRARKSEKSEKNEKVAEVAAPSMEGDGPAAEAA